MASPARILQAYLVDLGIGALPDQIGEENLLNETQVRIYTSSMTDDIDYAIAIYNGVGRDFGRRQRDQKKLLHPGIKIMIRHPNDEEGYALAQRIVAKLELIKKITVVVDGESNYLQTFHKEGSIISLGEETNERRQLFVINGSLSFQDRQPPIG